MFIAMGLFTDLTGNVTSIVHVIPRFHYEQGCGVNILRAKTWADDRKVFSADDCFD